MSDDLYGISYVTCPVLGIRAKVLFKSYIENILKISLDDFKEAFPDSLLECSDYRKNINDALNEEIAPGITKRKAAEQKSAIKRSMVDENGLTSYQKSGKKTKETHLNKIDENGFNGYQRISIVARPKQNETMAKQGLRALKDQKSEWLIYRDFCIWFSKPHYLSLLDGKPSGIAGTKGAWQIDHIYPLIQAFNDKISPFLISNINNLRAVTWEINILKNSRNELSFEELLKICSYSKEMSDIEYSRFMNVITSLDYKKSSLIIYTKLKELFNDTPDLPKK